MRKIALMDALAGLIGQAFALAGRDDVLDQEPRTVEVRPRRHSERLSAKPIESRPQEVKTKSESLKRMLAAKGRK